MRKNQSAEIERLKAALEASEARYKRLFDGVDDPVFLLKDAKFYDCNSSALRMYDCRREDLIGKSPYDFSPPVQPDGQSSDKKALEKIAAALGGPPQVFEWKHTTIKGASFDAEVKLSRLDIDGDIFIQAIVKDVTRSKRLEAEVTRRLILFEQSPDGILIIDPRTAGFLEFNTAAHRQLGYTREEFARLTVFDIEAKETASDTRNHIQSVLQNGRSEFETQQRTRDGEIRDVHVTAQMVDVHGEPVYYCFWRDITERKRAESALRLTEEALSLSRHRKAIIMDSMAELVILLDRDLRVIWSSAAMQKQFGLSAEQMEGNACYSALHGLKRPCRICPALRAMESGQPFTVEDFSSLGKRWNLRAYPVKDRDGNIQGAVEVVLDISEQKHLEEKLRESEEKYRKIFEGAIEGIFQTTKEGRYLNVNPAFARMFGYSSPREMVDSVTDIGRQLYVDPQVRRRMINLLAEHGRAENFEAQAYRKDGSTFWISMNIQAVQDASRNILYLEGTNVDITGRKKAEQDLKESEERYRQFIQQSFAGIYVAQKGVLVFVNDTAAMYAGYAPEELTGRRADSVIHPEDRGLAKQQAIKMLRGEDLSPYEFRIIRKNGQVRWMMETVRSVQYGNERAILGNTMDITDRKWAAEALKQSQELERSIFSSVPHALVGIEGRRIIFANDSTEKIFGWSPGEIIGKSTRIVFRNDKEWEEYGSKLYSLLKTQRTFSFEFDAPMVTRDGREIYCSSSVSLIGEYREGSNRIVALLEDITARKKEEDLRRRLQDRLQRAEKMEALGTLAGGIAHDLNNALGIMVGYSEMVLHATDKSHPLRRDMENILKGGEMAAAIVQDMLTMARRGVHTETVVNINTVFSDLQKSPEYARLRALHPHVEIMMELQPDILNIQGSPFHLGKSIMNLVLNAAEAMKAGGTVTIATCNRYLDRTIHGYDNVREGDYVVVSVADTGEGISADDLKHIFEPFYTKKVMGRSGTGLGLAVVWGTVKDHNGHIDVLSEPGKGSIFTLYFPVTREEVSEDQTLVPVSEYMGKGETVLVIDDIQGQRELASRMLARLNYRVESAASGEEAVEYLKGHKVDVLVLDMIMDPGMDGYDTYMKILELHPGQKAVIVSGFSESERVRKAQEIGAGVYVKKPYVLERLGMAVKKELGRTA